jgi:hypothetical protein
MPACEREFAVLPFPALAGIDPAGLTEQGADVTFDVLRQLELAQIGLRTRLQFSEQCIVAKGIVATYQPGFMCGR